MKKTKISHKNNQLNIFVSQNSKAAVRKLSELGTSHTFSHHHLKAIGKVENFILQELTEKN